MTEMVLLDRQEEEHLLRVLEAMLGITEHRQLYMWAQGALQGLIPHKVLVCMQVAHSQVIRLDSFHSPHLPKQVIEELTGSQNSSILQLHKLFFSNSIHPTWVQFEAPTLEPEAHRHIKRLYSVGLSNVMLCGTPVFGGVSTQFMFLEVQPVKTAQRTTYFLELLLANLHLSYLRTTSQEKSLNPTIPLSDREHDILRWVSIGKSNQEIAELLFISPYTVKNHVHNILKKLKVKNRMQAARLSQSILTV